MGVERGKYNIVYADPPWEVKRGPDWSSNGPSKPLPYMTMSIAEIKALSVYDLAAPDAHLYLWVINKYLPSVFDILDSWGFGFSTMITWCKPPHGIGIGGTFVQTTEHLIFARRGRLKAQKRFDSTWIYHRRPKRHSEKPAYFRDMIVQASGDLPRVELFAVDKIEGWDSVGYSIDNRNIVDVLGEMYDRSTD